MRIRRPNFAQILAVIVIAAIVGVFIVGFPVAFGVG